MHFFNEYIFYLIIRLREGVKSNQSNWEDCTMFVQDLISPGVNVTVEITKEEADNFVEVCKMNAHPIIHDRIIDNYVLKLSESRLASRSNIAFPAEKSVTELSETSVQSLKRFKVEIEKRRHLDEYYADNAVNTAATRSILSQEIVLQDTINVDEISKFSQIEMDQLLSCSKIRTISEQEIINILTSLKTYNSAIISVTPFGSITYGFGGHRTNFNVLITTGKNDSNINCICCETLNQDFIGILVL